MKHVIPRIRFAATVLAALVVAAAPAAAQEDPGPNGAFDLRGYGGSSTQSVPPTDERVIEAIPDPERYAELSAQMTQAEAAYDAAIEAEDEAEEAASAAYAANDSAGGDAAYAAGDEARNRQETLKAQSKPLAEEMAALESEGEDALRSGGERGINEAADDMFVEPGEVGAASDDAPDETAAGASDGLQREPQQQQEAAPAPAPAPQSAPEADPYGTDDGGGGGGLNPLTLLILLAVLAGVGAVFGPRLLTRARGLPGVDKVAAASARARAPVQASADEDPNRPDPTGPAPRMGPWSPDVPSSPAADEPTGPPKGRIERVKPHAPDPSPAKPGPAPAPAPPRTSDLDGDGDLPPDEDDVPPWERSSTHQRVGSLKPRPRPDAPLTPEEAEYFGLPGTDAPPAGTPRPRTRRSPLSPPPPRPSKAKAGGDKKPAAPAPPASPAPLTEEEKELLRKLPEYLRERTIGQDHACGALAKAVRRQRVGFGGERPVSVMFCGTTGVGKTETAKALADALFGGEDKMIRLDMSEYQDKLQASRFVGAPPGYVGHDETPPIVEKMLEDPRRVVLFDEIEKADPKILDYLLQILDDGRLTSSKGETLDFGQAVVVLTSNLGSEEIRRAYEAGAEGIDERDAKELLREKGMRPEFVARLGEIVTFRPLKVEHVREIAKLLLRKTSKTFQKTNGATIELTDEAVAWIGEKGYEPENGARPLRGVIERYVETPLTDAVLDDGIARGDAVTVDVAEDGEGLILRSKARS